MNEPDIDIESLRRPRRQRLVSWLSNPLKQITHIGWRTTPATVTACRPARISRYYSHSIYEPYDPPILTGYIVEFSYIVNSRTFTGVLDSPVEVQPGDEFNIRYNPVNPEENNSLGSTGDSGVQLGTLITWSLVLLILVALLMTWFHHGLSLPSAHDLTE